jgi:hypothetical protein
MERDLPKLKTATHEIKTALHEPPKTEEKAEEETEEEAEKEAEGKGKEKEAEEEAQTAGPTLTEIYKKLWTAISALKKQKTKGEPNTVKDNVLKQLHNVLANLAIAEDIQKRHQSLEPSTKATKHGTMNVQ